MSVIVFFDKLSVFSDRLKYLMQVENISKRALANKTGLQRKSILNWLNGKFYPRYDALIILSNFFCVSTDYLIGRSNDNNKIVLNSNLSYEKIHKSFVEKLEKYIEKEKLSRYMFSKKIKIGQSTLSRWLDGNSMPETSVLIRIADLMGESTDYLLGRE